MWIDYGKDKNGEVLVSVKELSFSKDIYEIKYKGGVLGRIARGASEIKAKNGQKIVVKKEFTDIDQSVYLDDKKLVTISSLKELNNIGFNTPLKKILVFTPFILFLGSIITMPSLEQPFITNILVGVVLVIWLVEYMLRKFAKKDISKLTAYVAWPIIITITLFNHYWVNSGLWSRLILSDTLFILMIINIFILSKISIKKG